MCKNSKCAELWWFFKDVFLSIFSSINIVAASDGGSGENSTAAKEQLSKMLEKYGKNGGWDLDDLDEDFDDLGIDDASCSEEEE